MVDLSQTDTFDDWFFHSNEPVITDDNQSSLFLPVSSPPPPPPPTLSSNESPSSLPITRALSLSNNDEENPVKKRKNEQKHDLNENKKSKQTPAYMRRNIRHLFTNDKLQYDTLTALKAEQDRLRRLEEINDNYLQLNSNEHDCIVLDGDDENERASSTIMKNHSKTNDDDDDDDDGNDSDVQCVDEDDSEVVDEKMAKKFQRLHVDDRVNIPDENGDILINVNHPSDDPDLYIPKHLCSILKPHQIGGTRFMYDNIVESLQHFQTTPGLGCILAHSMGCGKTIQVITFIDILLRYTSAKSILVVVPINTIQNWLSEFNRWCPIDDPTIDYKRPYRLYILNETSKKFAQRAKIVQNWSETGGTLIIGYEMFRLMVTKKCSPMSTATKNRLTGVASPATPSTVDVDDEEKNIETMEEIRMALMNPDLVICDEGHRIKNHQASVAVALKSITTHRRIVLTGYPLQNNLIEYWCMVDFVRPNYLGSKQEFCNMFERPILNGQCVDSTTEDRQIMRARAHVLHSLLEGFIQRRGHDVLQVDLPPKSEYVVLLKLSSMQRQLYMKFLETIGVLSNSADRTMNPLRAFALCCKIWNHADVLFKFLRDRQEGSDLDFDLEIDQNSSTTNRPLAAKTRSTSRLALNNRASPTYSIKKEDFDYDFANSILNNYVCGQLSNGIKFQVALEIINLSIQRGDKVLLFSQSLLALNKLEEFLSVQQVPYTEQKWEKNVNYYRLDGGTNSLEREKLINAFNAPNSNVKLFLLSTRAGCLGINLIAANRVIVLDVSWNPCLDAQAVCRVYRYGQRKHCFIYRLIADFTMEKRIYDRQIAKQGMSDRVVDELQPQNQFTRNEVENLIHFAAEEEEAAADLIETIDEISDDPVLSMTCKKYAQSITKIPFTHESLLCDRKEYQLTSAEKRRAQKQYQHEKRMHTFSNRSRSNALRASAFGSRYLNDFMPRPYYYPPPLPTLPTIESPYSSYHNYQTTDRKLEQLKQQGISVQSLVLQSPLEVRMNASQPDFIPIGTRIHMIKSPRGSYIRTPDGKFFAIRQSPLFDLPKPIPVIAPPPPQPPPPPPSLSSLLDDLLFDSSPLPSTSSYSPLLNDLTDEIDLLLDDKVFTPPSSSTSTFGNLNSWQDDYFQPNDFYSDFFPTQSNLSISSTNNPSAHELLTNSLTLT